MKLGLMEKNMFLWIVRIKNKWLKEGGIMFILILW